MLTAIDWSKLTDPGPMMEFLRSHGSERELRLFACACCRRIWDLMRDPRSCDAVEAAECYAKGLATASELRSAFDEAMAAGDRDSDNGQEAEAAAAAADPELRVEAAAYAAAWAKANRAADAAEIDTSAYEEYTRELFRAERLEQAKLLRGIAVSFAPESPSS